MSESASPPDSGLADALRAGREAYDRHAWAEAYEQLSQADREGALSGADLETLAEASFFAAHAERGIEAKERAFKAHLAAGDRLRAAHVALDVAHDYGFRAKTSIASAWTRRAERLLEGQDENYAHGYLALMQSDVAKSAGNIDAALELAERGVQIASRTAHADLQATALTALGNREWEGLLTWHDDLLRAQVAKQGGEIVNSTGDGFFVAFDSAEQALACARSIQQVLAEHRGTSVAPPVRIGLHTAEANRRGADYSGIGVHTAARVAALAGAGEILATAETLVDAGDVPSGVMRDESLKGVTAPVRVASVAWA